MTTDLFICQLDKTWIPGYWKVNASLLDEKDFQDQLEVMSKR